MVGLGFCRVFLFGGPRNSFGISACLIDKIKSSGTQLLNFRTFSSL